MDLKNIIKRGGEKIFTDIVQKNINSVLSSGRVERGS
jgi:hypothetical protein